MATPFETNPYTFIQKANSSIKLKRTITLQDIEEVLKQQPLIRINDRGLFVVLLAELIHHQYSLFLVRIKSLHAEICPPIKAVRKKRQDRQQHPPKRARKAKVNVSRVDIQQIASESVSHPSHLQEERVHREQGAKEESKGSKPSQDAQPGLELDFKAELQKMGEIDIGDIGADIEPQLHPESEDTSSGSQSTKVSSNAIPNLTEKLRILGGDVSFEKRTIPKRRGARLAGATVKRKDAVVDISITLDETRPTIDPREIPAPVLRQKCRALDFKRKEEQFEKVIGGMTVHVKQNVFAPEALRRLKDFQRLRRKEDQPIMGQPFFDIETGQTMFQQEFGAASTHVSGTQQQSAFNRSVQEHIDSNLFKGQASMSLSTLKEKTKKPKEQLFMKLLWMSQRGEVIMSQENPQRFGEITVKLMVA